ncbi:PH domain-containing protein [Colwellia piezophila]|uniref:PH domain-containing protein n=1 Tax=Colwellia piezophila TaxID=211668 RepID=UPI00036F2D35|nr:PH domain-containing protein [Colwellia piezophila]
MSALNPEHIDLSHTEPSQITQNNFTNHGVDNLVAPSVKQLQQKGIARNYAQANRYLRLSTTLVLISALAIVWWLAPQQDFISINARLLSLFPVVILIIATLGFVVTLYGTYADKVKFYALREHDISYSSGLIFYKTVSQPILRIQHVELKRGPIDRKIGLAKLQVFSAGGALHTFEIPGLPIAEAQKIRQFILDHKDSNRHG